MAGDSSGDEAEVGCVGSVVGFVFVHVVVSKFEEIRKWVAVEDWMEGQTHIQFNSV